MRLNTKLIHRVSWKSLILALGLAVAPGAWAYVGPGAGLGILAALVAILGAIVLSIVGLVLWPIRALARQRRQNRANQAGSDQDSSDEAKDAGRAESRPG